MKNRLAYIIFTVFCFFLISCGGGGGGGGEDLALNTPPSAPLNVISAGGNGQASLSWEKEGGATTYHVYWSTKAGVNKQTGTKIPDVSSIYYHTGLTNGTTYFYVVTAANQYGESGESQEVSATPSALEPPLPPSNVAVLAGDRQVMIRWSPEDAASDITSHNIYWSTSAGITKQGSVKISNVTTPYTHKDLINGTTYYYVVTSVNAYGEGLVSAEISATPQQATPSAPSGVTVTEGIQQVVISWTTDPEAVFYNIYWSTSAGVTKQSSTMISGVTSPYTHKNLTDGTTYYYMVTAVYPYGESLVSEIVSATPHEATPSAPRGVTATAGNREAVISWTSVPEATSYNLYWSTSSDISRKTGTKIAHVTSPYTHEGLTSDRTYYYVVTAVNAYGESADSGKTSVIIRNTLRDVCLAMGDSITVGKGVGYDASYVYLLSVNWGKTVYNEGVNGALSSDGAYWIDSLLARYNPKYITIFFGANDNGFYPIDWTIGNLRYMIQRAKAYGTKPVIATLTPVFGQWAWMKPSTIELNKRIRQLASAEGVTVADLEEALNWNSDYILSDGLHPNVAGHSKLASAFQRALTR